MSGGHLYCPGCYNYRHSLRRAVVGFFAWHLWRILPKRLAFTKPCLAILAYGGDWIYDTRLCGCRLPLVED